MSSVFWSRWWNIQGGITRKETERPQVKARVGQGHDREKPRRNIQLSHVTSFQ
jgi:hypothetical protein